MTGQHGRALQEGGQTVFPLAEPPANASAGPPPGLRESLFEPGTWQDEMVGHCYTKLAVRPRKGDALLFYSQRADGTIDPLSKHGGCPVLEGTKWAANVWVWNGPREGSQAAKDHAHATQRPRMAALRAAREAEAAAVDEAESGVAAEAELFGGKPPGKW